MQKRKILFIAEAVTLAHVCRLYSLAKALDPVDYEIYFACDQRMNKLFDFSAFRFLHINTIRSQDFLERIETGKTLYTFEELLAYANEDLKVIEAVKPDLVVGDMRVSLSVVTQVAKVPYWLITNAYWSPYSQNKILPVPEIRGVPLARIPYLHKLIKYAQAFVFNFHLKAINRLCEHFKLKKFNNFLESFTFSAHTFYADIPALSPCGDLPYNHSYLGQVKWSAAAELPDWFDTLDPGKKKIFINLGSSGPVKLLEKVIEALKDQKHQLIISTAGRVNLVQNDPSVFIAEYLPAEIVTKACDLLVCNGGSPSSYLALSNGVPVLGICTNLDQLLNMRNIESKKAGIMLRSSEYTGKKIKAIAEQLLSDQRFTAQAKHLAAEFSRFDAEAQFKNELENFFGNVRLLESAEA